MKKFSFFSTSLSHSCQIKVFLSTPRLPLTFFHPSPFLSHMHNLESCQYLPTHACKIWIFFSIATSLFFPFICMYKCFFLSIPPLSCIQNICFVSISLDHLHMQNMGISQHFLFSIVNMRYFTLLSTDTIYRI